MKKIKYEKYWQCEHDGFETRCHIQHGRCRTPKHRKCEKFRSYPENVAKLLEKALKGARDGWTGEEMDKFQRDYERIMGDK